MVRTLSTRTKHTIVHAAKHSAKNVKAVAGQAIGAAHKTVAGTVSTRAKHTIVHATKRSAKNVTTVAGEAIGAAQTMVRTLTPRTKRTVVHAAKRGAKNLKAVAGEAIGAAAKASTEVILKKTGEALAAGHANLTRSSPAIARAAEKTARQGIDKPLRGTRRSARSG